MKFDNMLGGEHAYPPDDNEGHSDGIDGQTPVVGQAWTMNTLQWCGKERVDEQWRIMVLGMGWCEEVSKRTLTKQVDGDDENNESHQSGHLRGGGGKIGNCMKQKKPKSTLLADNTQGLITTK